MWPHTASAAASALGRAVNCSRVAAGTVARACVALRRQPGGGGGCGRTAFAGRQPGAFHTFASPCALFPAPTVHCHGKVTSVSTWTGSNGLSNSWGGSGCRGRRASANSARALSYIRPTTPEGPSAGKSPPPTGAHAPSSRAGGPAGGGADGAGSPVLPVTMDEAGGSHAIGGETVGAHGDTVPSHGSAGAALLRDNFGRQHTYLRISLTEKCNLRCKYCMPADGVPLTPLEHIMTTEEVVRLARLFVSCGVDKIRLTGGEPLVRRDAPEICAALGAMEGVSQLGITTNGLVLKRRLPALVEAGVTSINISLDTLVAPKFQLITRRVGHERVIDAIDAAVAAGLDVKVNCVVMNGINEDELVDFVHFTKDRNVEVRFIEYMPFDDNAWSDRKLVPYAMMLDKIRAEVPDLERRRDGRHAVAKTYQAPGYAGRVGFITSMSQHFCGGCNRLRLTADGNIKACLFGADEYSLRDAMRAGASDDELLHVVATAVAGKKAVLGGNGDMYGIAGAKNRPMITIGG